MDRSWITNYLHETLEKILGLDVKNLGVEDGSGIVNFFDNQPVSEGRDVQHVEKSGSGSIHPLSFLDDVDGGLFIHNFNKFSILRDQVNISGFRMGITMISMEPFEILVGMDKAWKKDVFSGPKPVFIGSMYTLHGAKAPARAGARTRFSVSLSRTSTKSNLVKTKPTFPRMWGSSL